VALDFEKLKGKLAGKTLLGVGRVTSNTIDQVLTMRVERVVYSHLHALGWLT